MSNRLHVWQPLMGRERERAHFCEPQAEHPVPFNQSPRLVPGVLVGRMVAVMRVTVRWQSPTVHGAV